MDKKILKKFIPKKVLRLYQYLKMLGYRMSVLEQEVKNQWLLDKLPEIKNQKEMICRKEFKIYSQTGEDGIINYLFDRIGTTNKTFVEIGVEDGKECNTANLSLNFGWSGLLIEGDPKYSKMAKEYYAGSSVKVVRSFITMENVNRVIKNSGIERKIDLLSIDIDGNDYWVWKAIDVIEPRVVIVEYNSILGPLPKTIKYNPAFQRIRAHSSGFYYGASLAALEKLAESKGYILVGCNSLGFNAFFIRKKEAKNKFHNLSAKEADPLPNGDKLTRERANIIKNMPFEIV